RVGYRCGRCFNDLGDGSSDQSFQKWISQIETLPFSRNRGQHAIGKISLWRAIRFLFRTRLQYYGGGNFYWPHLKKTIQKLDLSFNILGVVNGLQSYLYWRTLSFRYSIWNVVGPFDRYSIL